MTDALGQVAWRQEYQAFGADYNGSASGNPYKYNAKQLDTEFGLYYYGARYYDPVTGRFTAPDPITFVESPYAYCGNNPASMVDPTGMITKPAFSKDDMPNMECSSDYDIGAACRGAGGSGVGWGCTDWQYDKVTGKYVRYWYVYFTSSLTDASGAFFSNYSYQARIANKHLKMDLKQYYNNYCNLWLTENDRNILNSVFSTSSQNERSITKRLPFIPHRIEYNRGEKTLIVTWRGETYIFEASNNADSKSNGIWPDGIYEYKEWIDHKEDWFNENSQYGSFGNFVYYVDGRVGMGIHSGRANKGGWKHPTNGCIRTTDAGTSCLFDIVKAVGYLPFLYIH